MARHKPRRKAPRPTRTSSAALIVVLSLLATVTALLQTMVVPVLSKMSADLGVSSVAIGWVVTINLLAAAVTTPVLSKCGDLYGRRMMLLGIVAAVAVGCVLAAATSNYWALLVARVIQGCSFCIFPLAVALLRENVSARHMPLGISCLTGAISVGSGAGLVLAGILTHGDRDYRNVFWFTGAVAVVLLVMAIVVVPQDIPHKKGRVDWAGAFALGLGLVLLLLSVTQGNNWGWTSPVTISCLVGSVLVFIVWFGIEKRVSEPLVPIAMMKHRALAAVNVIGLAIGFGLFLVFLGITALVQVPDSHSHGFSASVLETSFIYLLPAASIGIIASPLGGVWVTRYGGRTTLFLASLIGLVGYVQLMFFHAQGWHIVVGGLVTNAAFNIGFAAVPAVVVSIVRPEETALANAMASISRTAGSALGSAMMVALIAGHLMTDQHPTEDVFVIAFGIGALTMVLSLVIALVWIPRHTASSDSTARRVLDEVHPR